MIPCYVSYQEIYEKLTDVAKYSAYYSWKNDLSDNSASEQVSSVGTPVNLY